MQQQGQFVRIFLTHIVQTIVQHTGNAVCSTQYARDIGGFQSSLNHSVSAGINDGRRTAGLAENTCSGQMFTHIVCLLEFSTSNDCS